MPISNNRVAYLIKSTGIKAGIKKNIHPHIFRHTHASLLAEAGTQLEVISQRLGHSSSNITRKIYLHITQNLEQKSIEKFSDYMQKVSTF
ncbi:MAG TPA: tyrosine-type recombinase/integrase [Megamonas hypermegale]|uniref:Tyrosine-type recombinase/integrase n=2 Tax=Megamonas hypermegale TaxID=158847 RepID=A0A921HP29_9FIRM|nr:tyrosine-type recombinase/integrase [Megamonas hypermegale]